MRRLAFSCLSLLGLAGCCWCDDAPEPAPAPIIAAKPEPIHGGRILVFTRTKGYRHDSIPVGVRCLRELAAEQGLEVDQTEDPARFTPGELARVRCVVFLSTTGDVLETPAQEAAFQQWLESGGTFLGVHAATDTEYTWPWYGKMVGAYFASHPRIQPAVQQVVDAAHPATGHLPARWKRTDEWYNFRDFEPGLRVLLKLDESTYSGGKNGVDHPSAWCKPVGKGRMFYTAGGHTKESYAEPEFRAHLAGALRWLLEPAAAPVTPSPDGR